MKRRDFLLSSAAFAVAGCMTEQAQKPEARTCATQKAEEKIGLAVQMWSVNDLWKKDPNGVFAKLRAMGYTGVQSLGFLDMDRDKLAGMLRANDLKIVDMPFRVKYLDQHFEDYLQFFKTFGIEFVFDPYEKFDSARGWVELAAKLADYAEKFREHGIRVGYHNHQHELRQHFEGVTPLEILAANKKLDFELDVGHVKLAKRCPVAWLERLSGRVPSIHAKPGGGNSVGGAGDANDWKAIMATCRKIGVKWAVVECETRRNTFEDVEASAKYIRQFI